MLKGLRFADACARGHEQFCTGVAQDMPTQAAAEAVEIGCRRLQDLHQAKVLQSFSSCRDFFSVLSSNGREEVLQADTIQQSSEELEAVRSRVQDLYKHLQEARQTSATFDSQVVAAMASCLPDDGDRDQAEKDALAELMADALHLDELLKGLEQLKPQLDTQVKAGSEAQEGERGSNWPGLKFDMS